MSEKMELTALGSLWSAIADVPALGVATHRVLTRDGSRLASVSPDARYNLKYQYPPDAVLHLRGTVPLLFRTPAGPGHVTRPHRHDPRRARRRADQTPSPESLHQGLSAFIDAQVD